jgi:lipopolysaccharide/colanic/teichoic acid biosynthesis glycosyltransferase
MESQSSREVVVVDIRMKFWSMVFFMVKWVIASIPAIIILAVILAIVAVILQALTGGGTMWWHGRFGRPSMM